MTRLPGTLIAGTTLLLSITAIASAAEAPGGNTILAGGPIYAQTQTNLYCHYVNFGSANITPTAQQVFELSSTTPISTTSTCANGTAVPPNTSCYVYPTSEIGSNLSYSCKLIFSTAATNVRGSVQVLDSNYNPLATVELR